jgi:DNA-binding response OmpR family regulator
MTIFFFRQIEKNISDTSLIKLNILYTNKMSANKILIIDDSKTFIAYMTELLGTIEGTIIYAVRDSREAVKAAEEFRPNLILTGFEMPFFNGNQVCSLIKSHPSLSIIPIMMLTANDSEDQLISAIAYGADDYIYKGAKKEVVLIKIRSLLRYKNIMEADTKNKQMDAVKALIATSNHEFNNALFISNGFLRKLKRNVSDEQLEIVIKLLDTNKRMIHLVQNLESLKEITLAGMINEVKMLKL